MATTTENLGLTLPAGTDRAEISVLNENFQTLDTFAGQATDDIQQAQETANAAAPQASTYTKDEVDAAIEEAIASGVVVDTTYDGTSENAQAGTAVAQAISTKVDKETGKGLSTNDFTNTDKANLETALTKANAAAPQSTTYTKTEVDTALVELEKRLIRPVVYGWHIDSTESDPSACVTYLADAVGMTPAAMGSSSFSYGSWKNAFFMPKPCAVKYDGTVDYYLDPDDYTLKSDGTASDIADPDYPGNFMMEWPKIWYKFEQPSGEPAGNGVFYCSTVKIDESYHCWCNINSKNQETDHFYTAIYNGTGTTKLRSISGVALTSENGNGNTTGQQEIDRALANNVTSDVAWYTDVYSDRLLINSLLVLMSKSLDTQGKFGRGLDSGSQTAKEAYVTGLLNDKGLFWGSTSAGTFGVKVFGMENWWGCVWQRIAGCIMTAYNVKVKLTYGTADGTTVTRYNSSGDGYISLGTAPNTDGYVSKMLYSDKGYMPLEVSGSSSTYYCDYLYQSSTTLYLLAGGYSNAGARAGAFSFDLSYAFSRSSWHVSAALSLKPLV